jgi:hypothetical protein
MLLYGVETVSPPHSRHSAYGPYVARSVLQAMALIVLAAICFLACVFLLFVLVQWTRDTKRRTTTRPMLDSEAGPTRKEKRPRIVGSRRTVGKARSL